MLWYLNAYVAYSCAIRFAIWPLRISSLKIITQLLLAYSHNKYYEYMSMTTIYNSLTCHELHQFYNGEWTCSIHGKSYHNLAIKAHECISNNRVKNIISRPSYFRTVELADFIAYADKVVSGLQKYLNTDNSVIKLNVTHVRGLL